MWAKLIVSVTLLPMLVHSVVGCCWHHVHTDGNLTCLHSATETHSDHQRQHGHRHSDSLGHRHHDCSRENIPAVPDPCEHEESCDDVRCVSLVTEPIRSTFAISLAEQIAVGHHCCIVIQDTALSSSKNSQHFDGAILPSEHCALIQVWVV